MVIQINPEHRQEMIGYAVLLRQIILSIYPEYAKTAPAIIIE